MYFPHSFSIMVKHYIIFYHVYINIDDLFIKYLIIIPNISPAIIKCILFS